MSVSLPGLLIGLMATTTPAPARTIGEILAESCPKAVEADQRQARAHDLADDSQYGLAKEAAALYYDCYRTLSDPYARDWAHEFYLTDLSLSAQTSEQMIDVLNVVISGSNNLAASTHFDDVRAAAIKVRDSSRALLRRLTGNPQ